MEMGLVRYNAAHPNERTFLSHTRSVGPSRSRKDSDADMKASPTRQNERKGLYSTFIDMIYDMIHSSKNKYVNLLEYHEFFQ